MDQAVHFHANPDSPAQSEMSQEHVWPLDNGVEMTSSVQVLKRHVIRSTVSLRSKIVLSLEINWNFPLLLFETFSCSSKSLSMVHLFL